jgi:hypothetical protein
MTMHAHTIKPRLVRPVAHDGPQRLLSPMERAQTMASCLTMTTGMVRKPTLHVRLLRN